MLDSLAQRCHLRKISLVQMQLSGNMVDNLVKVIKNGKFLIELDISYNALTCENMMELLKTLAESRTLQLINLSWNVLSKSNKTSADAYYPGMDVIEQLQKEDDDLRETIKRDNGDDPNLIINAVDMKDVSMREGSALDARASMASGLSLTHSMTQRESTQLTRKVETKFDKYQKKLDKENKKLGPETEQRNNEVI
jgi:hypothetical protein